MENENHFLSYIETKIEMMGGLLPVVNAAGNQSNCGKKRPGWVKKTFQNIKDAVGVAKGTTI